ncbi:Uncharacterised protein [Citrobacter amalonaticus]|nr:Uncharacterised protein [Citrobacter amalonaticus]
MLHVSIPVVRILRSFRSGVIAPDRSPDADQDWFPVYEVILCVPGAESYFNRALGIFNKDLGSLYIRNVALPR